VSATTLTGRWREHGAGAGTIAFSSTLDGGQNLVLRRHGDISFGG